jgi:hypothetical protein
MTSLVMPSGPGAFALLSVLQQAWKMLWSRMCSDSHYLVTRSVASVQSCIGSRSPFHGWGWTLGRSSGRYIPSLMPVGGCCCSLEIASVTVPTLSGLVVNLPVVGSSTASRSLCCCIPAAANSILCPCFGFSLSTLHSVSFCGCILSFRCSASIALICSLSMRDIW